VAEAGPHRGIPTWLVVVGGGGVAVLAAMMFLGGSSSSSASTNAPSQTATGDTTDAATDASSTSWSDTSGNVPMIPTLDANGAVQTGNWPTGWNTAAPAPSVPSSQMNNGTSDIQLATNQAVLSGMSSAGAPVWWVPFTYADQGSSAS
jgi:hypothetical protein